MTKCLHCDKEFEDDFIEGEWDNPILFCCKYHRREYRKKIIDDIHSLNDLQLKKLREHILDKGYLNIIIDDSEGI